MRHRRALRPSIVCAAVFVAVGAVLASPLGAADMPFAAWLAGLRADALGQGVRAKTFDEAFRGVRPIDRILELDRRQPEFVITFWSYLDSRVTPQRVDRGRELLQIHRGLLDGIAARYGADPATLVAFWGLESNFGADTGNWRAVDALATLAYDGRRGPYFRDQLLIILALMDRGEIAAGARSSWAGALGQPQFMPATFRDYAVDHDGDGRRDLWGSEADALASAAHYLAALGWQTGEPWGREVSLPPGFDYTRTDLDTELEVGAWRAMGVRLADGRPLPDDPARGSILLPAGARHGPALLVYRNFRVIMGWNRSLLYAISVGHLADRISGGTPFLAPRPADEPRLARTEVMELQARLERLGYDTGGADGMVGARTRDAIRNFQAQEQLPADGYPTPTLLQRLRQVVPD